MRKDPKLTIALSYEDFGQRRTQCQRSQNRKVKNLRSAHQWKSCTVVNISLHLAWKDLKRNADLKTLNAFKLPPQNTFNI